MTSANKKKILFITTAMTGGGAERVVVEILNNLDSSKYISALALYRKQGPYLQTINKDIPVYEISGRSEKYRNVVRSKKSIRSIIESFKPDLVMSHLFGANLSVLRAMLGCRNAFPVVITEHNNLTRNLSKKKNPITRILNKFEIRLLYKKAAKIVAVSQGIGQNLIDHGISKENIEVIHNPIDIQKIQNIIKINRGKKPEKKNNQIKQVIAVGRLIEQKAFSDLIKAFTLVRDSVPSKLTILGEGELRPELEKLVKDLRLDDHVNLPGFLDDPWTTIYGSDLFVMSSHWEGFGNVIVEAMTCETPVVSTDCDYGPREIIIPNKDGLLVPVGDIQAISNAMIKVLKNEQLCQQLAANAKEKLKQFDSKVVIQKYEQLFEKMLA